MAPVVDAYQAMCGASFLVAVTFAAEIGDVRRFDNPRQLMSFLGLVPPQPFDFGDLFRAGAAQPRRPRAAVPQCDLATRSPAPNPICARFAR
jgi:transposase